MKKTIYTFCLILLFGFVTSCTVDEYECEFKEHYKYNKTSHWQECSVRGCKEKIMSQNINI